MKDEKISAYIASFPAAAQRHLKKLRKLILVHAPSAVETISYGMPAYKLNGKSLLYFAGYAHHVGFYATPTGHSAFKKELAAYKTGKGSVQFPLDEVLPEALIVRMIKFRVNEMQHPSVKPTSKRSKTTKSAVPDGTRKTKKASPRPRS
jgi:uncharacterized protein YdhG (YjbR/CyaY superfamily)